MSDYYEAMQFELESELRGYEDYYTEIWAGEIEDMKEFGRQEMLVEDA